MKITKDILIEDLVNQFPVAVRILRTKGIICLACGEPVWGTLATVAHENGFSDSEIKAIVDELNTELMN